MSWYEYRIESGRGDDTALQAELEAVTADRDEFRRQARDIHEDLWDTIAERDRARDLAAHLEAELARLRERVEATADWLDQEGDAWGKHPGEFWPEYDEGRADAYDIAEQRVRALLDEDQP